MGVEAITASLPDRPVTSISIWLLETFPALQKFRLGPKKAASHCEIASKTRSP
jgi:hypothetical protein